LRGAGDSFILGCNHPIWPSFGLIHGSRSSGDVKRVWGTFEKIVRQNLNRNWQNGKLWWNDPAAVTLSGDLPPEEYRFHASVAVAAGGLVLSGDDLSLLTADRLAMLKKLLPPTAAAAEFDDESLRIGTVKLNDRTLICVFNWGTDAARIPVKVARGEASDLWSGRSYGRQSALEVLLKPHEATVLVVR
jgi:alpha-galactosidase